ncbi:outer membrane protein transport protein [Thiomicrospira sp. R3]|uniref:OmpP1/FadL family transporter n=1 Tax=Thiomicrospira sp. R3 TaxID=3035472 RepID=UPI00259B034D|nr:outer membrane protein transport protein [Thiomicrospira sp. R3]WFE68659.1 outer membrane protein transport protein [Thiomicrospira sp. R3]
MKKTRLALAIASAAMISQPVLATNGDHLIGLGAQARALGGTGAAAFFGSENALTNPALLGKAQGTEFVLGGTLFKPNVKSSTNVASAVGAASQAAEANGGMPVAGSGSMAPAMSATSANDTNIIPEVSLATRLTDNLVFGLGIFGSAGMGVDYRDNPALFDGYSNLQLMKFAPTLAYNEDSWGIGFAPVIQYGALDINYETQDGTTGNGMSTDLGYGFNIGAYFNLSPELTLGLAYQSAINMEYKDQITRAAEGFGLNGMFTDKLEQPSEIKVGMAYTMGRMMYTADYKQIGWGSADGYKDFNWKDQDVFGLGVKFTESNYWVGAGYNYGKDPIEKLGQGASMQEAYANAAVNLFNNHFFPGIVESHYTFGGGYQLTKNIAIDAAVVMASKVTKTVDTSAVSAGLAMQGAMQNGATQEQAGAFAETVGETSHRVTHSQLGYTIALRMNF